MQQKSQNNIATLRKNRISTIKQSLRLIPIIRKNTQKIELKLESYLEQSTCSPEVKSRKSFQNLDSIEIINIKQPSLFDQKYEILECIGEGANGFVNKCRKAKTGKVYAVKSVMMDEEHIMELRENFMAIHDLQHENIVQYHAMYIDMRKKLCSTVMEYVNLPSLVSFKISPENLKPIIYQILSTIQYLHQRNICHRDIKPQNILFDADNLKIKLIDFGTARNFLKRNNKVQMLTITGTLFYRAPQMFSGAGYDQKVDVWSAGVLIYKLVCGKTPFESLYLAETISKICKEEPSFQGKQWDQVDNGLKNLIRRMLKKDRNIRLTITQCLRDVWFYSLTLSKLSPMTISYQENKKMLQNAEYEVKILKKQSKPLNGVQDLNYVVKKVDGEDYHQIDSQEQDTACSMKSSQNLNRPKPLKRKHTTSLIF